MSGSQESFDDSTIHAFVRAAAMGHNKVAMLYLGDEPDLLDMKDDEGHTALVSATMGGKIDTVKLLLDKGAEINLCEGAAGQGCNALMAAVRYGQLDIIDLLLERNADVLTETTSGWTALKWAVEVHAVGIARNLLEKGAYVELLADPQPGTFTTLGHSQKKRLPAMEKLLKAWPARETWLAASDCRQGLKRAVPVRRFSIGPS